MSSSTAMYEPSTIFATPGDALPSSGGHGTLEILEVIKAFSAAKIRCCVVGVQALRYFGVFTNRNGSLIFVINPLTPTLTKFLRLGHLCPNRDSV
jgi:hypothetical protein